LGAKQTLERERRWARPAAALAIVSAPLYIVSILIDQAGDVPSSGLDTERYRAIDGSSTDLLASVLLRGLAFAVLCVPLFYLFRAAQARSERVNAVMAGFAFIGPVLLAVQGVIAWIAQTQVASDFVAQAGPGGDIYSLLDDLVDDSTAFDVASNLLFPAIIGMLVAMIYVPLQAMRVGLLTRFFGTLGMALGAGMLFIVPAISLLTISLWFLWLGLIILGRTPGPRPPAWDTGVAIPWPRPGDEPKETDASSAADLTAPASGDEDGEDAASSDHSARRERARKRKRKRRR
jgi:hypothetical protein